MDEFFTNKEGWLEDLAGCAPGISAEALNLLDFFGSFFHQGKNERMSVLSALKNVSVDFIGVWLNGVLLIIMNIFDSCHRLVFNNTNSLVSIV